MIHNSLLNPLNWNLNAFSGKKGPLIRPLLPMPFVPFDCVRMWGKAPEEKTAIIYMAFRDPAAIFSDEDIQKIINIFDTEHLKSLSWHLTKIFDRLPADQMDQVLSGLCAAHADKNPDILLKKLDKLLKTDCLEAAIQSKFPEYSDASTTIDSVCSKIRRSSQEEKQQNRNRWKQLVKFYIVSTISAGMDWGMHTFGLKEDHHARYYDMSSRMNMRFNGIKHLWEKAGECWTYLDDRFKYAILGGTVTMGSLAFVAGAVGVVTSVWALNKYVRALPNELLPFENYTAAALDGLISPIYGRDREIQDVIDILCSNDSSTRLHALIKGQSRVGKTEIIKGVARRIAMGDVPPELQGKKLYYVNTTKLFSSGGDSSQLEDVLVKIKGHESEAVFVFDEIHEAFRGELNKGLGQKLKTLMDPGPGSLKYCICATTKVEFEQHVKQDAAFCQRIKAVNVEPLNEKQTLVVLNDRIKRDHADLTIEQAAVRAAASVGSEVPEFAEKSQPFFGKTLLNQAIHQIRNPRLDEKSVQLQDLIDQRNLLESEYSAAYGKDSLAYSESGIARDNALENLKDQIDTLKEEINASKKVHEDYKATVKNRKTLKNQLEVQAMQLQSEVVQTGELPQRETKRYLLSYHYLQLALDDLVAKKRADVKDISTVVTEEMVRAEIEQELTIVKTEARNKEAAIEAAEKAKFQEAVDKKRFKLAVARAAKE
ncbi:MAG: AAA family ATPase [Chlamydiales bacterium]|nr:AAA family ATPase [Chlamydiales bacterium]